MLNAQPPCEHHGVLVKFRLLARLEPNLPGSASARCSPRSAACSPVRRTRRSAWASCPPLRPTGAGCGINSGIVCVPRFARPRHSRWSRRDDRWDRHGPGRCPRKPALRKRVDANGASTAVKSPIGSRQSNTKARHHGEHSVDLGCLVRSLCLPITLLAESEPRTRDHGASEALMTKSSRRRSCWPGSSSRNGSAAGLASSREPVVRPRVAGDRRAAGLQTRRMLFFQHDSAESIPIPNSQFQSGPTRPSESGIGNREFSGCGEGAGSQGSGVNRPCWESWRYPRSAS